MKQQKLEKQTKIYEIYEELKDIYSLHKIQQEALLNCYDENRDYGHIFAIDTIYNDKLKNIINKIQYFI